MGPEPLHGIRVISLAVNLPGPLTAARYTALGAAVTKVVPPAGDPLAWVSPAWHDALQEGQEVIALDLKSGEGQAMLAALLSGADALLTSTRPAALARLGLDWPTLSAAYPRLCHVAIVGYPAPDADRAGHDLIYQASVGLLEPSRFPRIPLADYAGSERAVSALFALLWARERTGCGGYGEVSLVEALAPYADALRYGLLAPGTLLGGGSPLYGLYRAASGWIALAALERHFSAKLACGLGLAELTAESLAQAFLARTAREWEAWAAELDIPLAAVCDPLCPSPQVCDWDSG
jgi:crotonobetainyl-CoA:carnitine CoA-transferase CaiB-like acyl-CoA transferase